MQQSRLGNNNDDDGDNADDDEDNNGIGNSEDECNDAPNCEWARDEESGEEGCVFGTRPPTSGPSEGPTEGPTNDPVSSLVFFVCSISLLLCSTHSCHVLHLVLYLFVMVARLTK